MNSKITFVKSWSKNYKIKIFTLISAVFLYFYVVTDNDFTHIQSIPLQIINKPAGLIPADPVPESVRVQFRGSGKSLLRLLSSNKHLEVDLNKVPNRAKIPLTLNMIKDIPRGYGITPIRIVEPESLLIRLDHFSVKKVPVVPEIELIPMDAYTVVGGIHTFPDSITVSGPESVIRDIRGVRTEESQYRELIKDISDEINLLPPDTKTVTYSENSVKFEAAIQRIGEIEMTEIPIHVLHIPPGEKVIVIPSTLSLRLQGGVKVLKDINKRDIYATIDYKNRYRYSGRRIPATIEVPPDITFSDARPKFFELVVEK